MSSLKSAFLHLLLSILLLPAALSAPDELKNLRSDRIFEENKSSRPPKSSNAPLVPALFVFGDSTVDCGANYHLLTIARPYFLPYGRDFDTHRPTGRFCNGRIVVDYLALHLGLPFVPPFVVTPDKRQREMESTTHGVNYASGGAGVLYFSGSELGQHVPLAQQMVYAKETFQQLAVSLGSLEAAYMISDSIFYFSFGSNDFIHYYLPNASGVKSQYPPWEFNQLLALNIIQELKNLYYYNVRKVVVMGLAPLGCTPFYSSERKNRECVKEINNMIMEFNFLMRYMVNKLSQELPDAKITFCDAYEGSIDIINNRKKYGFDTTKACCGDDKHGGLPLCLNKSVVCRNASNHIWWDEFHPTDAVNAILADNVWSGQHAKMCYPMYLQDMVSKVE